MTLPQEPDAQEGGLHAAGLAWAGAEPAHSALTRLPGPGRSVGAVGSLLLGHRPGGKRGGRWLSKAVGGAAPEPPLLLLFDTELHECPGDFKADMEALEHPAACLCDILCFLA